MTATAVHVMRTYNEEHDPVILGPLSVAVMICCSFSANAVPIVDAMNRVTNATCKR